MTIQPEYKWQGPHEWLKWAWDNDIIGPTMLFELIKEVDADTIQDFFQAEMEAAGYFEPLNQAAINAEQGKLKPCPECDSEDVYEDDHVIICRTCGHEEPPEEWNDRDDEESDDD